MSQMILEYREDIASDFEGTIIDLETVGEFDQRYYDSRQYQDIEMVIFGYIDKDGLTIACARGIEALDELLDREGEVIDRLLRPFYAFNASFERAVLFNQLGREVGFGGELQKEPYERKADAVKSLDIPNYDDPYYDRGLLCMLAWRKGDYRQAMAHNRACLLKERDILLKRGFRRPDELRFVKRVKNV